MKKPLSVLFFIFLVLAAVVGNYSPFPLLFGFDFLFGGIAVLLILYLYGIPAGVATAILASSYTYFSWGHPYGIIIFSAEALFVGLFLKRLPGNFLFIDALYWAFVGFPLVWFAYASALHWDSSAAQLVVLKQSLNGIYNALVASYLVYFTPLRRWAGLRPDQPHPFGQILACVLASFLLLPALAFLVIYGNMEPRQIQEEVKQLLLTASTDAARDLVTWRDVHLRAIEQSARAGAKHGMKYSPELQHDVDILRKTFPDLLSIYVADANGMSVAFSPGMNKNGARTVGVDFSDRDYFKEMNRTRKPILSPVFNARVSAFAPIVALGFPIVEDGRLIGVAAGGINLDGISKLLKYNSSGQDVELTVFDQVNSVVAGTGPNHAANKATIARQHFEQRLLGDSVYHSIPQRDARPDILRWKESYFIAKMRIADDFPWTLVATVPARSYVDQLQRNCIQVLMLTLGLITGGLILSQVLSGLLTRPLSELAALTNQLPKRLRARVQDGWPRSRVKEISFLVDNLQTMEGVLGENFDALSLSKDALSQQARELSDLNKSLRAEIGERKQMEESLRQSERQVRLLATALVSAANAIVITEPDGTIKWVNPAFTKLTGYSFEEAMGQNPRLLKSGKHDAQFYRELWTTVSSGRVWFGETVNRRKDGTLYTEEQTIAPVVAAGGEIAHFVSIKQDITERKLAEATLRQNMEELEKANRVKNEFLAVMSHELRTPLNVIMGYSQMIREEALGAVTSEQIHALHKIKMQSMELLTMVNSILVVTKIEADNLAVELDAIDLETFINGLKDEYDSSVSECSRIVWETEPGLPPLISDATKLKHVMENLLNNAFKFSDEGEIRVSVKRVAGEEKVALAVADRGIGIAEKDLSTIFDKFHQADSSSNRNYGGSGLGLYIVKKYTELLGGEVRVESVLDKGSTFIIVLPLRHVEPGTDRAAHIIMAQRNSIPPPLVS